VAEFGYKRKMERVDPQPADDTVSFEGRWSLKDTIPKDASGGLGEAAATLRLVQPDLRAG
ncbi:unnamed protein product, partial [Symbiodinium necroappetens]